MFTIAKCSHYLYKLSHSQLFPSLYVIRLYVCNILNTDTRGYRSGHVFEAKTAKCLHRGRMVSIVSFRGGNLEMCDRIAVNTFVSG